MNNTIPSQSVTFFDEASVKDAVAMVYGMVLAAIFGCYVVSSFILFKFPSILHKRKNVKFVCRHISHRGGAGENYENTMTAFKYAVSLGTDMLELDVHLTHDEQVVVAHDANLQRTTNSHMAITDLDYAQFPPVKDSLPVDFMPGVTFSRPSEQDRQFPLLEAVFQTFPSTPINIDIKVHNDLLITKVSELVKHYNREHLTVWGNFSDAITQQCYKENSDMCLLFSLRRVVLLVLQLYTGLLPFMPLKETHLEIFMPLHLFSLYEQRGPVGSGSSPNADTGSLGSASTARSKNGNVPEISWWMRPLASLAHSLVIRPALFSHLAKRGIQTYLWVLNTEEDFHRAFKSGATGVMTDYPSKLVTFLNENPQYFQNYEGAALDGDDEPNKRRQSQPLQLQNQLIKLNYSPSHQPSMLQSSPQSLTLEEQSSKGRHGLCNPGKGDLAVAGGVEQCHLMNSVVGSFSNRGSCDNIEAAILPSVGSVSLRTADATTAAAAIPALLLPHHESDVECMGLKQDFSSSSPVSASNPLFSPCPTESPDRTQGSSGIHPLPTKAL